MNQAQAGWEFIVALYDVIDYKGVCVKSECVCVCVCVCVLACILSQDRDVGERGIPPLLPI